MRAPATPANESARLAALQRYAVLDTDTEHAFDDLARLAAHILEVPIALVSLVDSDRQWFKSRYGLDATELPRDVSFCGHVVADEQRLVVPDSHADARFADNPVVTGHPRVRFYAGMPLRTPDGFVLGSLCAIDHVPRQPTEQQLAMLDLLARQVVDQLEARRAQIDLASARDVAQSTAQRFAAMFAVVVEGVVVQDSSGRITASNEAAETILGLTGEQMRGRSSIDTRWRAVREDGTPFPGDEHPAMVALRTGMLQRNVVMGVQKPDGTLTWISINSLPLERGDEHVTEVVTTFHDITALRLAADRLAQQERLVTIGTLVAGVGHEINNPLAFLLGNLDLALEEIAALAGPSPSARLLELRDVVSEARVGADRIRRIVRGLRALSREDVALQAVDLEPVIDSSISMAQHELRRTTRVERNLADLPPVLADESRLTQVLVNLLMNAAQALPAATQPTNLVEIRGSRHGVSQVRLSVIDNGPGIPPEFIGRIFDPFFTTKPIGEGTGLGLAVSRTIVHALGGTLTVESEAGAGASFHIDLPMALDSSEASDAPAAVTTTGPMRVLIVDDDVSVLTTLRRVLAREYDVTAESDPLAALALLRAGREFDVIFCDLMMPHVTGRELHETMLAERPELASRFVFVTGGATTTAARIFLSQQSNEVIEKPFRLADVLAVARRVVKRHREQ